MAVATKSKKSYKYVEVTSLIGHANKFVKQVESYVKDNKTRYSNTVEKIREVIYSLMFAINQLCEHLELDFHLEIVSEEGERLLPLEKPAEDPYQEQTRALNRLADALDDYYRKQVEDQSIFLEYFARLMTKGERDEMYAAIPDNCRAYPRSASEAKLVEEKSIEKPKSGPGRPKKVKEDVESPKKAVEDKSITEEEEEPNFDIPEEEKKVSPNGEEKKAYVQDLGARINNRLDEVREIDEFDRDSDLLQSPFLLDDVKMFAKYIAIWWDSAILRRRNINPKFTYQPNMIPGWIAGFAHFAGKSIEDAEKEYKKRNGNMLEIKLTDRWNAFDTRFNEWMTEIREDSTNRWAVPLEVHSITKGDAPNMYTVTGLNILSKYCDFNYSRDHLTRVKLNQALEREGFTKLPADSDFSFSKGDARYNILQEVTTKIKSSECKNQFPGLGTELLLSEWVNHKSEYMALGRLRDKVNCKYSSPLTYTFKDLGRSYLDNPIPFLEPRRQKALLESEDMRDAFMERAKRDVEAVRKFGHTKASFDYIMRGMNKPEEKYIDEFEKQYKWK